MTILALLLLGVLLFFFLKKSNRDVRMSQKLFPDSWRTVLKRKVNFYNALAVAEQQQFENEILEFLEECNIVGVDTDVDEIDKLLIAVSGVIPVFRFPEWKYANLTTVLVYSDSFNYDFETVGDERNILGMVGGGVMRNQMALSKKALHHGFSNETDKRNTAIHEFVHLIDMMDGEVDGLPKVLMEQPHAIPWLDLTKRKIEKINADASDIRDYGATNYQEFFAVASEYFFERPKLLRRKHPELYDRLEAIFDQDMANRKLHKDKVAQERNEACNCGSGKKYKQCCGKLR